jgi:ABC-type cobalamin/Fe3+-siderophores transport system ATPase subunit
MIKSIKILDTELSAVEWLSCIEDFKGQPLFEFTPGINILWGANGSGKSSLLRLLARMFLCEQGQDEQKATSTSLNTLIPLRRLEKGLYLSLAAVDLQHDGSPTLYMDSGTGKGQIFPGHFDDDFFKESLLSHAFKGSSGQTTHYRLDSILKRIVTHDFKAPDLSAVWDKGKKSLLETFLKGTLESTKPTILLDEPDRSLDITGQVLFWKFVTKFQDRVQFIIATHNLLACDLDGANYLTFGGDQYLKQCRAIKGVMSDPQAMAKAYKILNPFKSKDPKSQKP